jgi:hypothetical protein
VKSTRFNGLEWWLKPTGGNQSSAMELLGKVVDGDHGTLVVRIFTKNVGDNNTILVRSSRCDK